MSSGVPQDLHSALDSVIDVAPRQLTTAVRVLSERYREQHARPSAPLIRSELDAMAYAAYRLPATHAAVSAVLHEVRRLQPDLKPESLLDVGAGPGTALWAAAEIWPLKRITALERNPRMVRLGKTLVSHARSPAIQDTIWLEAEATASACDPADITIAAYVLGEMPDTGREGFVRFLWEHASQSCVIVEPGTPRGSSIIRQAGDFLVAAGAHVVAPFPQDWRCSESEEDWCHFSQRMARTRIHRSAKEAALSYEDEKYSYVAASRCASVPIAGRVTRHPQVHSGHVRLVVCTERGIRHIVVTRSQREAYRRAKDLMWGSAIALEEADLFGL